MLYINKREQQKEYFILHYVHLYRKISSLTGIKPSLDIQYNRYNVSAAHSTDNFGWKPIHKNMLHNTATMTGTITDTAVTKVQVSIKKGEKEFDITFWFF